jgi:hypothetical protein
MMPRKKKDNEFLRDLAASLDPVAFARSIGIEPDSWQQDVLRSGARRLILCCSRQSGKKYGLRAESPTRGHIQA